MSSFNIDSTHGPQAKSREFEKNFNLSTLYGANGTGCVQSYKRFITLLDETERRNNEKEVSTRQMTVKGLGRKDMNHLIVDALRI
ncbi:CLUMA_CG003699, isoform A [Clunio marinus]|uniref:CLUMA_CG003699, isoform A n=1 Tax=Clunio marinus TaxID=568069 RepID=A0A1J1HPS9_9DIPT|nr:CLUMA_CG003699, isoform A [Clunio marinus]